MANAAALAAALADRGYDLVSGGTDNHLILVDLTRQGIGGKPAAQALDRAGIELNYNTVPFDPRKPFDPSGIRLGTPAITTRGLREEHMAPIAAWIDEAITAATKNDDETLDRIAAAVRDFLAPHPIPGWTPDNSKKPRPREPRRPASPSRPGAPAAPRAPYATSPHVGNATLATLLCRQCHIAYIATPRRRQGARRLPIAQPLRPSSPPVAQAHRSPA